MENTKETILNEALTLFAQRGYEGVSMRDIAAAVGIKAASLYNHYVNKEDIFNSIIDEMSARYEKAALELRTPLGEAESVADQYIGGTVESLIKITHGLFLYFLKDDFASKFRRMLIAEQFRNAKAGDVFQSFFLDSAIGFQTELFRSMIAKGAFIDCDPYVMALHFYSPIYMLLGKYDRQPDRADEALEALTRHVTQFSKIYSNLKT
jgi:AcrR family transcriptional regulator